MKPDPKLRDQNLVRISVIAVDGSTPREVGAEMWVGRDDICGTIGGGTLEWSAIQTARRILRQSDVPCWYRRVESYALGPSLGQCCGGRTRLLIEHMRAQEWDFDTDHESGLMIIPIASGVPPIIIASRQDARILALPLARLVSDMMSGLTPPKPQLLTTPNDGYWVVPTFKPAPVIFLYGAGHVGRAVVQTASALNWDIHWADTDASRFPNEIPSGVTRIIATDLTRIAQAAPRQSYHVIMTYSHALDLELCDTLLSSRDHAYIGVIGSKTKRARFISHLSARGLGDIARSDLICPIGIDGIAGKAPAIIALSLVADLARRISRFQQTHELTEARG
jgi:xanthine dehydrogenase accessory factor